MALTEDTRLRAREIVARYPKPRSALLPMLHLVQSEDGYVSPDGIAFCAEELGLTKAEVGAVATFYTMYKRRPTGDWLVSVCTNTVCGMLGGDAIFQSLSEHLGVRHDQTTADGTITLEHAECLAACDYAPVVTVNYEFYDNQDTDSATDLVQRLRSGDRPAPTRGAPLCTFKEISRQLAGFRDERTGAVGAGPAGEPTLAGARLAAQHRQTAPPYPAEHPNGRPAQPAPKQAEPAAKPAVPAAVLDTKPADSTTKPASAPAKPAERAPAAAQPAAPTKPAGTKPAPAAEPSAAEPAAAEPAAGRAGPTPAEPGREAAAAGDQPAAKRAARPTARPSGRPSARRSAGARPENAAEAAGAGRPQPSAHDAPLSTSDSDPSHPSDPADEKGE